MFMGAIGIVLAGVVIIVLALVFGWAFFVLVIGLAIGPVSYTHLDVYKRQYEGLLREGRAPSFRGRGEAG